MQILKKTKIVTTLGPTSETEEQIEALYNAGMNTVRLNFSHGSEEEHLARIVATRNISKKVKNPISVMLDTKGPEIRIGKMKNDKVTFKQHSLITIYSDSENYKNRICNENELTMSHDISSDVKIGNVVLVDDGKLSLLVKEITGNKVICECENDYEVITNKRVNLPGVTLSLPFLSEKDVQDIKFGLKHGIDCIAASFVCTPADVYEIRAILKEAKQEQVQIIAKIESVLGVKNFDEILQAVDGIMVARGDLGAEIPYQDVPYQEKRIIQKCRAVGKPVIVATQMLDSMTYNPRPTRAEVTDVYYATELGSDATMLSGETAAGEFPIITVDTMATINKRAEKEYYSPKHYDIHLESLRKNKNMTSRDMIALSVADLTRYGDFKFTIVLSNTGQLLKTISWYRPDTILLGVSPLATNYTAFGFWSSIYMQDSTYYNKLISNSEIAHEVAKINGAKKGDKFLLVHNDSLTKFVF